MTRDRTSFAARYPSREPRNASRPPSVTLRNTAPEPRAPPARPAPRAKLRRRRPEETRAERRRWLLAWFAAAELRQGRERVAKSQWPSELSRRRAPR